LGFLGSFKDDILQEGNLIEVMGYEHRLQETILMPKIRKVSDQVYNSDISSKETFSHHPLLQDPYEDYFVQVMTSKFEKAGEGLFAKVDIELGTVIAFYNGVRVLAETDTDRPTPYKISLDDDYDLDMPDEFITLSKYNATLAHKVCHSFKPNCEVDDFFHPRFGEIRCIAALQDIRKGDEITINYRYNLTLAPTWYRIAWARYQKSVRRLPEWRSAVQGGGVSRSSSRASLYHSASFADLYLS
jgi:histone-lysine N-methyltransferase SETD7